jgi:hypothetical protein
VVRRGRNSDLVDALALLVFVTIGVLTHDSSFLAWLRDLLCFEFAWFALWRLPLPLRWLLGVTLAVAVRAAFVGHFAVDFYGVALAFVALFVLLGRALLRYRM